jgi:hypothetical protein
MPGEPRAMELAEMLERAYRLALAVEALTTEEGRTASADGLAISAMASELLGVLDQARASLLRPSVQTTAIPRF